MRKSKSDSVRPKGGFAPIRGWFFPPVSTQYQLLPESNAPTQSGIESPVFTPASPFPSPVFLHHPNLSSLTEHRVSAKNRGIIDSQVYRLASLRSSASGVRPVAVQSRFYLSSGSLVMGEVDSYWYKERCDTN